MLSASNTTPTRRKFITAACGREGRCGVQAAGSTGWDAAILSAAMPRGWILAGGARAGRRRHPPERPRRSPACALHPLQTILPGSSSSRQPASLPASPQGACLQQRRGQAAWRGWHDNVESEPCPRVRGSLPGRGRGRCVHSTAQHRTAHGAGRQLPHVAPRHLALRPALALEAAHPAALRSPANPRRAKSESLVHLLVSSAAPPSCSLPGHSRAGSSWLKTRCRAAVCWMGSRTVSTTRVRSSVSLGREYSRLKSYCLRASRGRQGRQPGRRDAREASAERAGSGGQEARRRVAAQSGVWCGAVRTRQKAGGLAPAWLLATRPRVPAAASSPRGVVAPQPLEEGLLVQQAQRDALRFARLVACVGRVVVAAGAEAKRGVAHGPCQVTRRQLHAPAAGLGLRLDERVHKVLAALPARLGRGGSPCQVHLHSSGAC